MAMTARPMRTAAACAGNIRFWVPHRPWRQIAGSAAAARWCWAGSRRERAGQCVEYRDQPPPPYPGVARDLLIGQGNTLGRPVLPRGHGADAEDGPAGGQDDETGMHARASGGELALPDPCRGALVAAVGAVEIGGNAHLGGHAGTGG